MKYILGQKVRFYRAGPFRESTEELLFRARFDCTKMKQVIYFQHGAVFNYYNDESFKKTSVVSTMFIEQSFVLLRSDFTSWFFPQILTEKYLNHQSIDWGPDKMWCGVAYAFNHMRGNESPSPCSLVSVNALHRDTKQIDKGLTNMEDGSSKSYLQEGEKALNIFRCNPTFSTRWMNASSSISCGN